MMKFLLCLLWSIHVSISLHAAEGGDLKHRILADTRTYVRAAADERSCVWTDEPAKAKALIKEFAVEDAETFQLKEGEYLAVFLNDEIQNEFKGLTFDPATKTVTSNYVVATAQFRLVYPGDGKKYTHLTVVTFTPPEKPALFVINPILGEAPAGEP